MRIFEAFFVVCLGALACASVCVAQAPQPGTVNQRTITRIEFPGARRISRDTLQARIFSKPGDAYDSAALDRDYHALWNTHFFEDLHIEVQDDPRTPNGVIVSFYVTERPVIRRIEYVGNKSITESDILDAYKEKKVGLSVDSQFDPTVVKRAQVILQALLAAHGHQFAIVKPTFERIPAANAVKLVFHIDEGPKVKVGVIDIVGNAAFSRRKLIRTMRNDRPYGIPLGIAFVPIGSKTFDEGKLEEDMEVGIRQFYQNHGYYRVVVDVKDAKTVDIDKGGLPGPWPFVGSKHGKATNITIEIQEGAQYRMGDLRFRSADPDVGLALRTDGLAKIFPLKKGDIFAADKLRKSLETYRDVYGDYGYIDFTATPIPEVDEAHKVINLTLEFDQQKPYYVRRIEFAGNTTTRDKVIRREIVLDEGQIYNKRLWDLSVLRLNQLGYFNTIKPDDAQLNKDVKNGSVDILLKLKEKAKQEISFSGGVSGISGSFIGFSYQTNNFLGLGETLSVAAQIGSIERNLSFGFTEPYLFDRPISAGFTVFAQKYDYNTARQYGLIYGQSVAVNPALQQNYNTNSKGFTIFASYPMRKLSFARFGLNYGWSTTDITTFSQSATLLFQLSKFTSLNGPSALKGIRSSKLTPTISYDTVNSQLNPTAGKSFSYQFGLEGGVLGGNVNSIENTFDMRYFRQTFHKRNVIAFHFQAADITGYGGKDAPPYNKFYLGGENDLRGFYFYTVSPFILLPYQTSTAVTYLDPTRLNQSGQPTAVTLSVPTLQFVPSRPGGDLKAISNFEYRIPIAGPVELDIFHDAGINGILRESQLNLDPSAVALLHEQFPSVSAKPTIISSTNFRPHTSAGLQLVITLPVLQAPVRIYYAYNYLRVTKAILPPIGEFNLSDNVLQTLPPGVFQSQIQPQLNLLLQSSQASQRIPASLLEPKHTLNFTVSGTF